jgi:trans-aconitate methyltransferase
LNILKKYSALIIAVGSFQLITDHQQVFKVLQKLQEHLLPGGFILLDLFVHWERLANDITSHTMVKTAVVIPETTITLTNQLTH